ncbi:MAG: alpha/beta hydrolase [Proteobacteria bacterium]|nr:alpha/beta hydrolase [Pseudomonadota bacterium]
MPIKWVYVICLIVIAAGSFYLFYDKIENFLVFFPQASFDLRPETLRLNYKDVYFQTEDGKRLHGWFFPLERKAQVILFFHGNAGNISHRLDNVRILLERGLQVFIFDYRGYGQSAGRPSEQGIYRDGVAAYEYLIQKEKISPGEIVLFGRSLGAAVAIEVALRKEVKSAILESAFTSTKEMARKMGPFALFSPILPANYNNLKKIGDLQVPKLIIHGDSDEIVPFSMGRRLFEAASAPKFFLPLKGAGHNDTYLVGGEAYFQALAAFARDSRI